MNCYHSLPVTSLRLEDLLESSFRDNLERVAVTDGHNSHTYADLANRAATIMAGLDQCNIVENEPVLVVIDNSFDNLAAFYAIWKKKAVVVPVHHKTAATNFNYILSKTEARICFSPVSFSGLQLNTNGGTMIGEHLICFHERCQGHDGSLAGAAFIVFTSGTTGAPKGVVQLHASYCMKLDAITRTLTPPRHCRLVQFLQLTFSFGQWSSLLALAVGGTIFLGKTFSNKLLLELVASGQWDWIPIVPSMFRLVNQGSPEGAVYKGTGLWLVGGEITSAELGSKMRRMFPGMSITDIYGLTETNSADFILAPWEFDQYSGSIGTPTPGVNFRIVGENNNILEQGQVGELEVCTRYRMKCYFKDDKTTAESMNGDFLKTGDLGYIDESGRVRLAGRKKEIVNCGGIKLSPLEIEMIVNQHHAIEGCLCGAVPDAEKGESLAILLVKREGSEIDINSLRQWLAERTETIKIPTHWKIVAALPTGTTGKYDRKAIAGAFSNT